MSERDLFLAALDIDDVEQRACFLTEQCGSDHDRLQRLQQLLLAKSAAGSFLEPSVDAPTGMAQFAAADGLGGTALQLPAAAGGTLVSGKYTLVEMIGEGGMGSVWRAKQTEPVKRSVAVKLIKAGMDSKSVLARFEAERQALAVMDHPNIAKVLDGGLHDGRPFFVMELVKGVPITEYCDKCKLTPKQRLELFVPVCQAIQHAHQKGIIHRDIKPSNVLIALYDDKPVPKVIDFGIAKATGGTLIEHTIETAFGGVVGTPQYMSPEQASLNNLDIDTRSDVYSLGVLLYELLTGSPPFARKELQKAGLLEILRIVREEEPPRPSNKLSTADALPSLSANRGTEPKKLTGLLRNELDWIVMKALEKDRARRYETANGFAADVNRYLSGDAVQAHPPSTAYRAKKFVRRNRPQVIASCLVLFVLAAGVIGTSLGLLEARRQTEFARQQEAKARKQEGIAQSNADRAEAEKKRAVEFLDKAVDALRATTGTDVEQLIGGKTELGANEKAYLEAIANRWQEFARQEGTDEQARAIRAEGHFRVANLWQKLGRREEARPQYEQALAIQETLAADLTAVHDYRHNLAAIHTNLGMMLADLGKRAEQHRKALAIREKLAVDFPADRDCRHNLAASHANLGLMLTELGKRAEAEEQYKKALAIEEKLAADFPAAHEYRRDLATTHNHLGELWRDMGRAGAEKEHRKALAIHEKLAADFPAIPDYRSDLATSHHGLGRQLANLERRAEAEESYRKALDIQEKLATDFPLIPHYRCKLAASHTNLGLLWMEMGKQAGAEEQHRKALAIHEKLAADFPAVSAYRVDLGGSYCNFGSMTRNSGKPAEGLEWYSKAIRTLAPVHELEPRDAHARTSLRNAHVGRARTHSQLQQYTEAIRDWDKAIELTPKDEQPRFPTERAGARLRAGQVAEAVAEIAELMKSPNLEADAWYNFACFYSNASGKVAGKKDEYTKRAMEQLQRAVKAGYKDAAHMKKDTDLDALREREDFKKLIAELEKQNPTKEQP